MKKATLKRFLRNNFETCGILTFESGDFVFVLELPWKNNQRQVSCIPAGVFHVFPHISPSKGKCFKVYTPGQNDVDGRDEILIHIGNYKKNTLGCLLPGLGLSDIDSDGNVDVTDSAKALRKLFAIAPDGYELTIENS
jgi:hypothetical protein